MNLEPNNEKKGFFSKPLYKKTAIHAPTSAVLLQLLLLLALLQMPVLLLFLLLLPVFVLQPRNAAVTTTVRMRYTGTGVLACTYETWCRVRVKHAVATHTRSQLLPMRPMHTGRGWRLRQAETLLGTRA